MIIGNDRKQVIENIKAAEADKDFYRKVEINDPVLTKKECEDILERYFSTKNKFSRKLKTLAAHLVAGVVTAVINRDTEIVGLEKLEGLSGAIVTSNHFGPLENTVIRLLSRKLGKKVDVVSQITNFAMTGFIGFFMNYADTIPLAAEHRAFLNPFLDDIKEKTDRGGLVLIYPEQEMWFNYRKPRPLKRGAYYFAAKLSLPVVSCFVEITELEKMDTKEFKKVKYTLHVLDVLYPEKDKGVKENSEILCRKDYELKLAAYEKIYGKKCVYEYQKGDIAGWIED